MTWDAATWAFDPNFEIQTVTFPARVVGIRKFGEVVEVELVGGKMSRVVINKRRGMIVPRRWRKPR